MPEDNSHTHHHHGQAEPRAQEPLQEREYEIGKDEAHSSAILDQTRTWNANTKRSYDEYLHESLADVRKAREREDERFHERRKLAAELDAHVLKELARGRDNYDGEQAAIKKHVENIVEQLAVESDIATDRSWNVDEVANIVAKTGVQADAIASALAKGVAVALAEIEAKVKESEK